MPWVDGHVQFCGFCQSRLKAECYWNTMGSLSIECNKVHYAAKLKMYSKVLRLRLIVQQFTAPVDTGRKLNVLCTFNLPPVSTRCWFFNWSCHIFSRKSKRHGMRRRLNYVYHIGQIFPGLKGPFVFLLAGEILKIVAHKESSRTTYLKL